MIPHLGPWELGLVIVIILIVFGVGKLPQVGGAIGKGFRAFKKGQSGEDEDKPSKTKIKTTTKATANSTKQTQG